MFVVGNEATEAFKEITKVTVESDDVFMVCEGEYLSLSEVLFCRNLEFSVFVCLKVKSLYVAHFVYVLDLLDYFIYTKREMEVLLFLLFGASVSQITDEFHPHGIVTENTTSWVGMRELHHFDSSADIATGEAHVCDCL